MDINHVKRCLLRSKLASIAGSTVLPYYRAGLFQYLEKEAFHKDVARNFFFDNHKETTYQMVLRLFHDAELLRQCKVIWDGEGFEVDDDLEWDLLAPIEKWIVKVLKQLEKGKPITGFSPRLNAELQVYMNLTFHDGSGTFLAALLVAAKAPAINWEWI